MHYLALLLSLSTLAAVCRAGVYEVTHDVFDDFFLQHLDSDAFRNVTNPESFPLRAGTADVVCAEGDSDPWALCTILTYSQASMFVNDPLYPTEYLGANTAQYPVGSAPGLSSDRQTELIRSGADMLGLKARRSVASVSAEYAAIEHTSPFFTDYNVRIYRLTPPGNLGTCMTDNILNQYVQKLSDHITMWSAGRARFATGGVMIYPNCIPCDNACYNSITTIQAKVDSVASGWAYHSRAVNSRIYLMANPVTGSSSSWGGLALMGGFDRVSSPWAMVVIPELTTFSEWRAECIIHEVGHNMGCAHASHKSNLSSWLSNFSAFDYGYDDDADPMANPRAISYRTVFSADFMQNILKAVDPHFVFLIPIGATEPVHRRHIRLLATDHPGTRKFLGVGTPALASNTMFSGIPFDDHVLQAEIWLPPTLIYTPSRANDLRLAIEYRHDPANQCYRSYDCPASSGGPGGLRLMVMGAESMNSLSSHTQLPMCANGVCNWVDDSHIPLIDGYVWDCSDCQGTLQVRVLRSHKMSSALTADPSALLAPRPTSPEQLPYVDIEVSWDPTLPKGGDIPGGEPDPPPCDPGFYRPAGSTSDSCLPCHDSDEYTDQLQTQCLKCPAGGTANSNHFSCVAAAGYYLRQGYSPVQPGAYATCMPGYFCAGGTADAVLCSVGQWSDAGAASCTSCPAEVSTSNSARTSCVSLPGFSGSGTAERDFTLCPAGFFCSGGGAVAQPCAVGEYSMPGAADCSTCPSVATSSGDRSTCVALPGYYGTGMTSPDFQACPVGHACAGGTDAPKPCENDQYAAGGAVSCSGCPAHSGSTADKASCVADPGYYGAGTSASAIMLCPAGHTCAGGLAMPVACPIDRWSEAGATVCISCPDHSTNAVDHTTCVADPGYVGTGTEPGDFSPCPAGRECPGGNAGAVECDTNEWSASGAAECRSCPTNSVSNADKTTCLAKPGYFGVGTFIGDFLACPEGNRCSGGTASPQPCVGAEYQPATGKTTCLTCYAGSYTTHAGGVGAVGCERCPLGHRCENGLKHMCGEGTYASETGSVACAACLSGHYITFEGLAPVGCVKCAPGTAQPLDGRAECLPCTEGSYAPTPGSRTCLLCNGLQQYTADHITCEDCPTGTRPDQGHSRCHVQPGFYMRPGGSPTNSDDVLPCPSNTYQPEPDQTTCLPCPVDDFPVDLVVVSPVACDFCPTGTFALESTAVRTIVGGNQAPITAQCTTCDTLSDNLYCANFTDWRGQTFHRRTECSRSNYITDDGYACVACLADRVCDGTRVTTQSNFIWTLDTRTASGKITVTVITLASLAALLLVAAVGFMTWRRWGRKPSEPPVSEQFGGASFEAPTSASPRSKVASLAASAAAAVRSLRPTPSIPTEDVLAPDVVIEAGPDAIEPMVTV